VRFDAVMIAAPIVVFGFGSVLLSYKHYANFRGWATGRIFSSSDWPTIIAIVLVGFSLFITISHLGWLYIGATVFGGLVFSFLFMEIFRMWSQTALVFGPMAAVASIFVMRGF
jgi:hypothetical protein